jgi:hypothetical protein
MSDAVAFGTGAVSLRRSCTAATIPRMHLSRLLLYSTMPQAKLVKFRLVGLHGPARRDQKAGMDEMSEAVWLKAGLRLKA